MKGALYCIRVRQNPGVYYTRGCGRAIYCNRSGYVWWECAGRCP